MQYIAKAPRHKKKIIMNFLVSLQHNETFRVNRMLVSHIKSGAMMLNANCR